MKQFTEALEKSMRSEECVMIRICWASYEELHSMIINPESINIDESPRRQ